MTNKILIILLLIFNHCFGQIPVIVDNDTIDHPWTNGFISGQFSNIDIDLDGTLDILIFDRSANVISIFTVNPVTNALEYAPEYANKFPVLENWVLATDFNCDGKQDLITENDAGIKLYLNESLDELSFSLFSEQLTIPSGEKIYNASSDIPAPVDVDHDGDTDLLCFSSNGMTVNYYQNQAIENNNCEAPSFLLVDECWGNFEEDGLNNSITMNTECNKSNSPIRHAGSSVLAFDNNGDNLYDLLLGDLNYNNLVYLENGGTSNDALIVNTIDSFPINNSVDLNIFPAGYLVDVNNDDIKDLLVSPSNIVSGENAKSNWLYLNNGTNTNPNFELVSQSFLQNQTIDRGFGAYPVLKDLNKDGLVDLLVGNDFYKSGNTNVSELQYYKNVGTAIQPAFKLVQSNIANVSSIGLNGIFPTLGDLDADGDLDLIIGDAEGKIHFYKNTSTGNDPVFQLFIPQLEGIDVGTYASPFLFDLNNDGLLDLIIGERKGTLNYVENTGTSSAFDFSGPIIEDFGAIDVMPECCTGYAIPFLNRDSLNQVHLYVGSEQGVLYHYTDLPEDFSPPFILSDSSQFNTQRIAPFQVDVNQDNEPEWFIGGINGGIRLYGYLDNFDIGIQEKQNTILFFPNPVDNELRTNLPDKFYYEIFSIEGKLMDSGNSQFQINTTNLNDGFYFLRIHKDNKLLTHPFVVQH